MTISKNTTFGCRISISLSNSKEFVYSPTISIPETLLFQARFLVSLMVNIHHPLARFSSIPLLKNYSLYYYRSFFERIDRELLLLKENRAYLSKFIVYDKKKIFSKITVILVAGLFFAFLHFYVLFGWISPILQKE